MINRQDVEETVSLILKHISHSIEAGTAVCSRFEARSHTLIYTHVASNFQIANLPSKYLLMRREMRKRQQQQQKE